MTPLVTLKITDSGNVTHNTRSMSIDQCRMVLGLLGELRGRIATIEATASNELKTLERMESGK